jgi:hypothetical protein
VIMIDKRDRVMFIERVFNGHRDPWMEVKFEFRIQEN